VNSSAVEEERPPWRSPLLDDEVDVKLLLTSAIKFADIGHVWKPFHVHEKWTMMATNEFWALGDRERELSCGISPLCDRESDVNIAKSQEGFFKFVCNPFYELVEDLVDSHGGEPFETIRSNYRTWVPPAPPAATEAAAAPGPEKLGGSFTTRKKSSTESTNSFTRKKSSNEPANQAAALKEKRRRNSYTAGETIKGLFAAKPLQRGASSTGQVISSASKKVGEATSTLSGSFRKGGGKRPNSPGPYSPGQGVSASFSEASIRHLDAASGETVLGGEARHTSSVGPREDRSPKAAGPAADVQADVAEAV